MCHPSYTVFNRESEIFSSIWTEFCEDFAVFYKNCTADIDEYSCATAFQPKGEEPQNCFSVSSIPWVDFTAFNLNIYTSGTHLAPIFTIGKYTQKDGKTFMPLALQLHHAACDGYHAGQFVEKVRQKAQNPESWLVI